MSKSATPVVDAETQQFYDDLLQSVREFKAGYLKKIPRNQPELVNEGDVVLSSLERQISE